RAVLYGDGVCPEQVRRGRAWAGVAEAGRQRGPARRDVRGDGWSPTRPAHRSRAGVERGRVNWYASCPKSFWEHLETEGEGIAMRSFIRHLISAGLTCCVLLVGADSGWGQSDTRTRPASSAAPVEPRAGVPRIRKASAIL